MTADHSPHGVTRAVLVATGVRAVDLYLRLTRRALHPHAALVYAERDLRDAQKRLPLAASKLALLRKVERLQTAVETAEQANNVALGLERRAGQVAEAAAHRLGSDAYRLAADEVSAMLTEFDAAHPDH